MHFERSALQKWASMKVNEVVIPERTSEVVGSCDAYCCICI